MYQGFIKTEEASKRSGVMESRDHSKNGASPKSRMSRRNILYKALLFSVTFYFSLANTFAQDVITLKNGEDIKALVQEIGELDVKYKKFENPNGPNYTMKKSEIFMIRYANGSKDVFTDSTVTDIPTTQTKTPTQTTQPSVQRQIETPLEPLYLRGSKVYNNNGQKMSRYELERIMSNVPEALSTYRSGKSLNTFGVIISYTGGFILGFHIASCLINEDREINALVASVGSGISIIGIVVGAVGSSKIKTSFDIYNSAVQRQYVSNLSLNFGITKSGGIGLKLNF